MAISIDDIKKLRAMTGAGLADVKKALTEAEGDFDKAKELLRERGLAIAAKRSDRETSNGCVLAKCDNGFAAILALKCETDFVANGADFIALTQQILDAAVAAKVKTLDEVKELVLADGQKAQDAVTQRSGITGEKMELDGYNVLEGENIEIYDHMGKHTLCTMVQTNKPAAEIGHKVAMQVAAMKPVALNAESVPQEILDSEYKTAVEKTKLDAKGNITEAQADDIRRIKVEVAEEKAKNLPAQMVENIAKGRVSKFLKENCLVDQEFQFGDGDKASVSQWLKKQDAELAITDFKRFTLAAE